MKKIKFSNNVNADFIDVLRSRVMDYFAAQNISHYGNTHMYIKTLVILSLYLIPYFIIVLSGIQNLWIIAGLWVIMGISSAGIGLSVMHDANHGSYSKNKKINSLLGFLLNFIGGSATNWKLQHNFLHHSYTNIDGMDEDIDPGKVMRLSPHSELLPIHKWQHIYGWFLYGLMTIAWVTTKDYKQLKRFKDTGILEKQSRSYHYLLRELIISKVIFFTYLLIIPMIFSGAAWWQTLIFFFIMHFLQGFILTIVFQPAHVMPEAEYPLPSVEGKIENSWAIHQMRTTTNFAPRSRIFSWYVGGLNFQVEHHLFPNICHVHYKHISPIVQNTALEYSVPYHVQKTFIQALVTHGRMLKMLGRGEDVVPA